MNRILDETMSKKREGTGKKMFLYLWDGCFVIAHLLGLPSIPGVNPWDGLIARKTRPTLKCWVGALTIGRAGYEGRDEHLSFKFPLHAIRERRWSPWTSVPRLMCCGKAETKAGPTDCASSSRLLYLHVAETSRDDTRNSQNSLVVHPPAERINNVTARLQNFDFCSSQANEEFLDPGCVTQAV